MEEDLYALLNKCKRPRNHFYLLTISMRKCIKWDGGGMREAIVNRVGKYYYLSYDGAMPGKMSQSYWNACTARSEDLIHWEKRGVSLCASAITNSNTECKDFCSASSPLEYSRGRRLVSVLFGADHCSPGGDPCISIVYDACNFKFHRRTMAQKV